MANKNKKIETPLAKPGDSEGTVPANPPENPPPSSSGSGSGSGGFPKDAPVRTPGVNLTPREPSYKESEEAARDRNIGFKQPYPKGSKR